MAYMNQEKKAVIKANLDKVLKPLGIKYTLRVRNHMAITCTIKSAPFNMLADRVTPSEFERDYAQVNPYWFQEHYTGRTRDVLAKVVEAIKSADYYDRSDAMVDYFDTAYYFDINIGDYNKPFVVTKPTIRQAGAMISEEAIKAKILELGCSADFVENKMIIRAIG